MYCRAFGRTAKSASTAVAELGTCAEHQHVRRNGCKLIRFTSAVLLGLVFLSQWGKHEGFVKYFLRLRSNGKEKRAIFCNFRQPPSTPSYTFFRPGTNVAGSPLPCTWFLGNLDDGLRFFNFCLGLSYGLSKSKKRGKHITKLWKITTKSLGKN